jgi:putative addiction module component (TIGR02574 family)
MSDAERIFEAAMQLSPDEREEVASRLLDSLAHETGDIAASSEEVAEIRRRLVEARSGVPGIPWEDVKREMFGLIASGATKR